MVLPVVQGTPAAGPYDEAAPILSPCMAGEPEELGTCPSSRTENGAHVRPGFPRCSAAVVGAAAVAIAVAVVIAAAAAAAFVAAAATASAGAAAASSPGVSAAPGITPGVPAAAEQYDQDDDPQAGVVVSVVKAHFRHLS